jgi:hypothetical protein
VSNLGPGASQVLRAIVSVGRNTTVGATPSCLVTSTSRADATKRDAVKAIVTAN